MTKFTFQVKLHNFYLVSANCMFVFNLRSHSKEIILLFLCFKPIYQAFKNNLDRRFSQFINIATDVRKNKHKVYKLYIFKEKKVKIKKEEKKCRNKIR